jgi:hypothetical protein
MLSYDWQSLVWDFWRVMAEKAGVEVDVANHNADHAMEGVENGYY